jgi:hypothetical protein
MKQTTHTNHGRRARAADGHVASLMRAAARRRQRERRAASRADACSESIHISQRPDPD